MRLNDIRRKLLPDYAVIPAVLWVAVQCVAYFIPRVINHNLRGPVESYHDLSWPIDGKLPLITESVIIYVLAYLFWVVSFVWITHEGKEFCNRALTAEMLGKLVCMVIFVAFPTSVVRPEITGNSFSDELLKLIYAADVPDNLFPSMHCSVSWFAARYCLKAEKIPTWYKITAVVMTLAVFASVLLTKQHLVIDIFGGVAVAEICSQIGDRTDLYKIYNRLEIGRKSRLVK